ncbi:MAG: cytochrome c maturation protein CcmE [Dichotomicrobium sp.]
MTRKQRRSVLIVTGLVVLGVATAMVLTALESKVTFFYSPSDIAEKSVSPGQRLRLGGLVAEGSVQRKQGTTVRFSVTDTNQSVDVTYSGILPDLFREGQGVVTEGHLDSNGVFKADTVLARHDENYMPKEVADALKRQGVWQHGESQDGAAPARPAADGTDVQEPRNTQ